MRRNEKGFTLIELLIVIIILGILAVIGIPKFMNSKAEAIVKACQTNRSSLEDAGERYFFDISSYPGTTHSNTDAATTVSATACNAQAALLTNTNSNTSWAGPYIKSVFTCPLNGIQTYWFNGTSGVVTCTAATTSAVTKANLSSVASGFHALSISESSSSSNPNP
jgi:prepilin-type N-terminal cleavage/methylation domain-containing protein